MSPECQHFCIPLKLFTNCSGFLVKDDALFIFDLTQDSQFKCMRAEKSKVFHLSGLTITKASKLL